MTDAVFVYAQANDFRLLLLNVCRKTLFVVNVKILSVINYRLVFYVVAIL